MLSNNNDTPLPSCPPMEPPAYSAHPEDQYDTHPQGSSSSNHQNFPVYHQFSGNAESAIDYNQVPYDQALNVNPVSMYGTEYSVPLPNEKFKKQFVRIARKYQINPLFLNRMARLADYQIVMVLDDSASMGSIDRGASMTRWQELVESVKMISEIGSFFDEDGIDIFFLDKTKGNFEKKPSFFSSEKVRFFRGVNSPAKLDLMFKLVKPDLPCTPIVKRLMDVFSFYKKQMKKKKQKHLFIIATDGAPNPGRIIYENNGRYSETELGFYELMINRARHYANGKNDHIAVSIRACTNDQSCIEYLNDLDGDAKTSHLDVVDDYYSERQEIYKKQGDLFPFSYGDYIVKSLMGPVDPWFDMLDEHRLSSQQIEFARTGIAREY